VKLTTTCFDTVTMLPPTSQAAVAAMLVVAIIVCPALGDVGTSNCSEWCFGEPCNYWVENLIATCAELGALSACECGSCSVCQGAATAAPQEEDNFAVVALGIFSGVVTIALLAAVALVCARGQQSVGGAVRSASLTAGTPARVLLLTAVHATLGSRVVCASEHFE